MENENKNYLSKFLNIILIAIVLAVLVVETAITTTGAGDITAGVLVIVFVAVMIVCTVKRVWLLVLVVIVAASLSICYYSRPNLYNLIWESANNNLYTETIDSVWYNQESKGNNDMLIFTILRNKTCVTNSTCLYLRYFETISDTVEIEDTINAEGINKEEFIELGSNYLHVHSTLMSQEAMDMWHETNKLSIYINPDGISEKNKVMAVNDSEGSIYLYAADE